MNGEALLKLLNGVDGLLLAFQLLGVNYEEVKEAQRRADEEGRPFTADDAQVFLDQARDAVEGM